MTTSYFPPTIKQRLIAYVQANPRQPTKARILAEALGAPLPSLRRALAELSEDGRIRIVESRRGAGGGLVLEAV